MPWDFKVVNLLTVRRKNPVLIQRFSATRVADRLVAVVLWLVRTFCRNTEIRGLI